jgi:selenocysteine lyase/cysteine desulfurase
MTKNGLDRRDLIVRGVGGALALGGLGYASAESAEAAANVSWDWPGIRRQFALNRRGANLTTFLFASHPLPVRRAIERHRRGLDANTESYLNRSQARLEQRLAREAAAYLGTGLSRLAFTDSTTMGLGLVYGAVDLHADDEVVTTEHDFYSTHESLRLRAAKIGFRIRRIRLYSQPEKASRDEILRAIRQGLSSRTRVLAVTWVHSSTGVKLPIREIARVVEDENRGRRESERILLCVDGVHGFGNQPEAVAQLGCDVFVSGTHKWMFGPRGTGLIWATPAGAARLHAIIPSFDFREIGGWIAGQPTTDLPFGARLTPGGFHAFEHRWALADAFAFQRRIGRRRVAQRTAHLAQRLKHDLRSIKRVRLRTPLDPNLSAGLVCFEIAGVSPREAVDRLARHGITASVTPYAVQYVRFGPTIANSEAEVDRAVRAVAALR